MTSDAAPGGLEAVRAFLNTWSIPNDTRVPHDALQAPQARLDELRDLRRDLRAVLGQPRPTALTPWLDRHPLQPRLLAEGPAAVRLEPRNPSTTGDLLARVLDAVGRQEWHRLRACPGCGYVFYDTSRNGSRTWCRMTRDDATGRSCGNLAKARAKRARDRAARTGDVTSAIG
jgi:predicted RNA-binding Zn ribbon-like protein